MYQALLANRYLTTRVIPFIAVAAVALCTALVIIVVSVMSGFVDMVRNAGKTLMGDVIISYPIRGLPHYERLLEAIRALPEAQAATPVVDSWGLLKMPYDETEVVQVWGIEPDSFARVTAYDEAIHWRPVDDAAWHTALEHAALEAWDVWKDVVDPARIAHIEQATGDPVRRALAMLSNPREPDRIERIAALPESQWRAELEALIGEIGWGDLTGREPLLRDDLDVYLQQGLTLNTGGVKPEGIVTGIHVSKANERRSDGTYRVLGSGGWWMPNHEVTLTVLPLTDEGGVTDPAKRIFDVANEARFGVFQIDDKRVMVPITIAQEMLELDASDIVDPASIDPETGEPRVIGRAPARATMILVSAAPGVTADVLKAEVTRIYDAVKAELEAEGADIGLPDVRFGVGIRTWEEQNAQLIGPVEKERNLMRILFSIVYFVCAGLVLVIFWAIVYEKTRDIGILRSIGASRLGILWIFVRYGACVGVAGSIVGLGLAWLVVRNINHIHDGLGEPATPWLIVAVHGMAGLAAAFTVWRMMRGTMLPIVVGILLTLLLAGLAVTVWLHKGFIVWDPQVYYFTDIPNHVDQFSAAITMTGAVVFSIVGALIPAARAGDIDPVSALRYG